MNFAQVKTLVLDTKMDEAYWRECREALAEVDVEPAGSGTTDAGSSRAREMLATYKIKKIAVDKSGTFSAGFDETLSTLAAIDPNTAVSPFGFYSGKSLFVIFVDLDHACVLSWLRVPKRSRPEHLPPWMGSK